MSAGKYILELCFNNSPTAVAREFNARHPNRMPPLHRTTVSRFFARVQRSGQFSNNRRNRTRTVNNAFNARRVLNHFRASPRESIRNASRRLGISYASIRRILRNDKQKAYKRSLHQQLNPGDFIRRKRFCRQLLAQFRANPDLRKRILC